MGNPFFFIIKNFIKHNHKLHFKNIVKEYDIYISLFMQYDMLRFSNKKHINLMTIHSSKGLEYTYIFLMGIEEGILPIANQIEEERRLFYVAITRAKKKLYLTFSKLRKI